MKSGIWLLSSPFSGEPQIRRFGNVDKIFDKLRFVDRNRVTFPKSLWNGELPNGFWLPQTYASFPID